MEMGGRKYVVDDDEVGMAAVLDFDVLCATVALQTQGLSVESRPKEDPNLNSNGETAEGIQRMWEGGVLDCFDDHRIAVETACCPCYRFGKNMAKASLGSCFLQGTMYVVLVLAAVCNFIAFEVTSRRCFLYVGFVFIITLATYLGYSRTRIRKQFNIRGSNIPFGDCLNHLICPCCTLCQESRTLEMNNVQGGLWCGHGDTICIGKFGEGDKVLSKPVCSSLLLPKSSENLIVSRSATGLEHSWTAGSSRHSDPLVSTPISK